MDSAISAFIDDIVNCPHRFALPEKTMATSILQMSKHLFSMAKSVEPYPLDPLPELAIDGFHRDQIWEEIQLRNEPTLQYVEMMLKDLDLPEMTEGSSHDECSNSEVESEYNEDLVYEESEIEDSKNPDDHDIVDEDHDYEEFEEPMLESDKSTGDVFFDVGEYQAFTDQPLDEDYEFDYGNDPDELDSDDENETEEADRSSLMYGDFFDPPNSSESGKTQAKKDKDVDLGDHNVAEGSTLELFNDDAKDTENLSKFEKQLVSMKRNIEELEQENIESKPWQFMGESDGKARPFNSLLEEDLEFDYAAKPVPIITEQTTISLEDMIKKRVVDGLFDDVEKKLAPSEIAALLTPRPQVDISGEKSKLSLAEIYEDDFQKQRSSNDGDNSEQVNKEHIEIQEMFKDICSKLDALSNWHFTPKPAQPELSIVGDKDTPAIQMEEIIPANISDAQMLAPEEIYEPKKSALVLKSQSEMTTEEKSKLRKSHKRQVHNSKKDRDRVQKLLSNSKAKLSKSKTIEDLARQPNVTIVEAEKGKGTRQTLESSSDSVRLKL